MKQIFIYSNNKVLESIQKNLIKPTAEWTFSYYKQEKEYFAIKNIKKTYPEMIGIISTFLLIGWILYLANQS